MYELVINWAKSQRERLEESPSRRGASCEKKWREKKKLRRRRSRSGGASLRKTITLPFFYWNLFFLKNKNKKTLSIK